MTRSRFTVVSKSISILVFILLYIPLLSVMFLSIFVPNPATGGRLDFSMSGYLTLLGDDSLLDACATSFIVALAATVVATLLGTLLAYALDRYEFHGKKIFESLAIAPLVMPELVLGISLLIWFVLLQMTLGKVSIILSHVTFTISYIFVSVQARLKEFDSSIEEAAYDLGASPRQAFFLVLLPILRPAIISGAVMAFTISFDDFFITFFTAGVGADTLPLKIYSMTKYGISSEINALSTVVLAATCFMLFLVVNPFRKKPDMSKAIH